MADIESRYIAVDGVDSQPVTSGRWFKAGFVLIGGSCLVLVSILATSASTPRLQSASATEATNLVGLSSFLRSPIGGAVKTGVMNPMTSRSAMLNGMGSSPLQKLAITAIQANNLANQGRESRVAVKVNSELQSELSNMDEETKEKVEKIEEEVKKEVKKLQARDMAGVTAPFGFFDPLGFSTDAPEGKLLFYREVEVKHGRVAMLASLGILVGEQFHPLFGGNINVPSYIAFQQTPLQQFWPAVLAAIGFLEIASVDTFKSPSTDPWSIRSDRIPGDFGFDPFGLKQELAVTKEELKDIQTKELNNGRLAMIAAAGMIAQELATGDKLF